jgi:hypothetical protein
MTVASGHDAPALASWLEIVLATTSEITPTPRQILRRLDPAEVQRLCR